MFRRLLNKNANLILFFKFCLVNAVFTIGFAHMRLCCQSFFLQMCKLLFCCKHLMTVIAETYI